MTSPFDSGNRTRAARAHCERCTRSLTNRSEVESALHRPHALRRGGTIGIFSPSYPAAARYGEMFARAVTAMERCLDVRVVVHPQAHEKTGWVAGDASLRARAFRDLLIDPSIDAVFCAFGGLSSAELLEHLDPSELRAHPKIIVGFSDCTALLLGAQALGGFRTFYGPMAIGQFGGDLEPMAHSVSCLLEMIRDGSNDVELCDPERWTRTLIDWEKPGVVRALEQTSGREVWREGSGSGVTFGGNVETLNTLLGTPWFAPPRDLVLFFEAGEYLPERLARVHRALIQLRQSGLFERTRAMLVGRSPHCAPIDGLGLREVVLNAARGYSFPIIGELPFGHTDPIATIPIGAFAEVKQASIRFRGGSIT